MSRLTAALKAHFDQPRCVGDPAAGRSWRGAALNAACGDRLVLWLDVSAGSIRAAGFKAQGCPASMAIASAACVELGGLPVDAARDGALEARFTRVHGVLPPAHRHALALVRAALLDALSGAPALNEVARSRPGSV